MAEGRAKRTFGMSATVRSAPSPSRITMVNAALSRSKRRPRSIERRLRNSDSHTLLRRPLEEFVDNYPQEGDGSNVRVPPKRPAALVCVIQVQVIRLRPCSTEVNKGERSESLKQSSCT